MADSLPSCFFLIRRKGADDDAWEYGDADQVTALQGNPHFEVQECRPAGLPDPRLQKLVWAAKGLPATVSYNRLKSLADEIGRELSDARIGPRLGDPR